MARRHFSCLAFGLVVTAVTWGVFGSLPSGTDGVVMAQESEPKTKKSEPPAKKSTNKKAEEPKEPEEKDPENPFPRRFPAPALEGGAGWLNTHGEVSLKELRGKVVLLDFWTYCCINCMHVLPDLAYLEKKYEKELVVIGVHSAKFDNEKDSSNIRDAILRYEIAHPVVNDSKMLIWRKFGVNSWPTLVLIDPEGNYCGYVSGEGNREILDQVIGKLIEHHKKKGTLNETKIEFDLEAQKAPPTALRFPGKILADEAGQRLFISDSNHNRIVITDLTGKLQTVIGSGEIGRADGSFETAQFDHPQGMDLNGDQLYVADTENHLVRVVDLTKKEVRTIAGTGVQARDRGMGGKPLETPLASPWDVKFIDGKLYIAMAGPHQIWVWDGSDSVKVFAGSGREDIRNGPHMEAALAQPSGLATDGKYLYVADSEGSAIRKIPLDTKEEVTTVVGTSDLPQGRALFEFGDIDGIGEDARLQHPLGLAIQGGTLYVADSYNHKIKAVNIEKRTSKTFLGTGKPGTSDKPPELSEPAGLSVANNKLYIADTNNHLIRVYDLESKEMSTLELSGLTPPKMPETETASNSERPAETPIEAVTVSAAEGLSFEVTLALPEGFKLNPLFEPNYKLQADGEQPLVAEDQLNSKEEGKVDGNKMTFTVPVAAKSGSGKYRLSVTYSFCNTGEGAVCRFKTKHWLIPITAAENAENKVISLSVE